MFSTVLGQLTGLLDKRFTLNALFPALAFAVGSLLVGFAGAGGLDAGIAAWQAQDGMVQAGIAVLAVTALFFLAVLLASQMRFITRLFEGYVGPKRLRALGTAWHRQRFSHMEYDQRSIEYPADTVDGVDALPTRLGNILRSGERYPEERYGIDGVLAWPRLYSLLPAGIVKDLADVRAQMELTLVLSLLSFVFALYSGLYLAVSEMSMGIVLGCYLGALVAAWALYRAALAFAASYSSLVKATFDLHRLELLTALKVPTPVNRNEERRRWDSVAALLYNNDTTVWWLYTDAAASASTSASGDSAGSADDGGAP